MTGIGTFKISSRQAGVACHFLYRVKFFLHITSYQ